MPEPLTNEEVYELWLELLPHLSLRTDDRGRANELLGKIGSHLRTPSPAHEEKPVDLVHGWSWTKDDTDCLPMIAKRREHNSIEVVEVDESRSRTKPGATHHESVLRNSPDEVFDELERRALIHLKHAIADVARHTRALETINVNRIARRV